MNIADMLKNLSEKDLKEGLNKISSMLTPEQRAQAEAQIENISKGDSSVLKDLSNVNIDKKDGQNQDILSVLKNNPSLIKNISALINKKK